MFSIIIPVQGYNKLLKECMECCINQSYQNFEIIILSDQGIKDFRIRDKRITIIPVGKTLPGAKRNIGSSIAKGNILAFIDSDAYPEENWLEKTEEYFKDEKIDILGGSNLTPPNNTLFQKISGENFSSSLASGKFAHLYKKHSKMISVRELPSCNLFVRKNVFAKLNGFDETLPTEENIKLCSFAQRKGFQIWYAPDIVVYHHRREIFLPHLKQVYGYGKGRGKIVKSVFSFSNFYYFIPSIFLLFLVFGLLFSLLSRTFLYVYIGIVCFYSAITAIFSVRKHFLYFWLGIILTHLFYGAGF